MEHKPFLQRSCERVKQIAWPRICTPRRSPTGTLRRRPRTREWGGQGECRWQEVPPVIAAPLVPPCAWMDARGNADSNPLGKASETFSEPAIIAKTHIDITIVTDGASANQGLLL